MANLSHSMAAEFLHYNLWANLRLIEACLDLAPEQLAASAPGAYGSIYNTLVHIIKAEAGYYRRLAGVSLDPPFSWEASPSLSEIRSYAQRTGSALAETAEQMQSSDSIPRNWNEAEWQGQPAHYRAVGLLIQVVNHGVEHRTNITTIMAQLGLEPPGLDGWEYMRLNPDRMGIS